MDAAELRAMQAPIKERYKGEPGAAMITLKARGTLDDQNIACKVETGRALAVVADGADRVERGCRGRDQCRGPVDVRLHDRRLRTVIGARDGGDR